MSTNKSSQPVVPTLIESTRRKLNEIRDEWRPFFVHLDDSERQALPKMSDKTMPFATKALELARSQPAFVPPFVDVREFETDMANATGVAPVYREIQQLAAEINDLLLVSNSEAFSAALAVYAQVKMSALREGNAAANQVVEDLGKRFPGRRRKTGVAG